MNLNFSRTNSMRLMFIIALTLCGVGSGYANPSSIVFNERIGADEYKTKRAELVAKHLPKLQKMISDNHPTMGLIITKVQPNSQAEKAGITLGAIITSVNGINPFVNSTAAFEPNEQGERSLEFYDPGENRMKTALVTRHTIGLSHRNWRDIGLLYVKSRENADLVEDNLLCALLSVKHDAELAETALFHLDAEVKNSHGVFVKYCEPWIFYANANYRELHTWIDQYFVISAGQPHGLDDAEHSRFCLAVNRFDSIQRAIREGLISHGFREQLLYLCDMLAGGKHRGAGGGSAKFETLKKRPFINSFRDELFKYKKVDRLNLLEKNGQRNADPEVKLLKENKPLVVSAYRFAQIFEVPFEGSSFRASFDLLLDEKQITKSGYGDFSVSFAMLSPEWDDSRTKDLRHNDVINARLLISPVEDSLAMFGYRRSNATYITACAVELSQVLAKNRLISLECIARHGLLEVYANNIRLLQMELDMTTILGRANPSGFGLRLNSWSSDFQILNLKVDELILIE